MTAAAIISQLANEAWLKQAAKNIAGEYADDLYQEFFLLLLEKPQDEIVKVYSNGYIKFYSIKIMGRIFKGRALGSVNGFSKFLPSLCDVPEHISEPQHEESFDLERAKEIENEVLSKIYWFDAKIYRMYRNGMSITKIYKETEIDFRAVSAAIKRVKQQLENRYYAN